MENKQNIEPTNDPILNMGAHDPKVDLANNKNLFKKSLYVAGAFVVILICICTLQFCSDSSAKKDMSKADIAQISAVAANDSAAQAEAMKMYNQIANNSNATAAQRAKIISARDAYDKGDYKAALNFISDVKVKSPIIQTLVYCLEGDCYINLDKVDDSINSFEAAVAEANNNSQLAPYALHKLANVYRFAGNYAKEAETLKKIQIRFPGFYPQIASEIARAEAMATKK